MAMNNENQLPNAPDAEKSLLCCIMHDPDRFLIRASSDNIQPAFFYNATHERLFELICEQRKAGRAVDVTSINETIRDRKESNLSVSDLAEIMLTEYSENSWQIYADILRDRYARRLAIQAGQQVASQNLTGESAVVALKQAAEAAMQALVGSTAIQNANEAVRSCLHVQPTVQIHLRYAQSEHPCQASSQRNVLCYPAGYCAAEDNCQP
jgi:replicative DNA helicase